MSNINPRDFVSGSLVGPLNALAEWSPRFTVEDNDGAWDSYAPMAEQREYRNGRSRRGEPKRDYSTRKKKEKIDPTPCAGGEKQVT